LKIFKKTRTKGSLISNFYKQTELDVIKTNQIADQQDFIYLFIYFPRVTKCRLGLAHPCKALQATQKNAGDKAFSLHLH